MPANVVTIARTVGSLGEETAHRVAAELDFDYVDNEIITRAAEATGLDPAELERAEARKPVISRLLDALTPLVRRREHGPDLPGEIVDLADTPISRGTPDGSTRYESIIRSVIDAVAQRGHAVIVAHGAGMRLHGRDDTLRAFVTASHPVRVRRVGERGGSPGDSVREVDESDRAR